MVKDVNQGVQASKKTKHCTGILPFKETKVRINENNERIIG